MARIARLLLLMGLLSPGIGRADTAAVHLKDVAIDRLTDGVSVRIRTSAPVQYQATLIDSPTRLVIDLAGTVYRWSRQSLAPDVAPIREIRGSQWKPGTSRIVLELTRKVGYRIEESRDGLSVILDASATARSEGGAAAEPPRRPEPRAEAKLEGPPPAAARPPAQVAQAAAAASGPPGATAEAARPPRVAQAQTPAQAPAAPAPNGTRLISMDFKDADVVNLLRILAAESGRNIVTGDDVKGKVSISLRNVTWEQALETILEVRGLQKIERGGVIRVVSTEQLTKEREARARGDEAKLKAEIDTRTKLAEAQLKEADLAAKRLAAQAAAEEAKARGPLREETIRLSYADPEEVARTLQGILGIPPEGSAPVTGLLPGTPAVVPSGGTPPPTEPPFSALYGAGAAPRAPVSVSQDVLAKGITIRAHKPTNTIFMRHYAADLERIKKLVREQLDVPLPQVKIEARMEILDRNALEAIGVQWGGAAARNVFNRATVVGQGFQSAPSAVPGLTLPVVGGVLQPDGSTITISPTAQSGILPVNQNVTLNRLLPVSSTTGLPIGGNLVNLPFQLLPNAASAVPAGGIAFGIIGSRLNINLALQALETQGKTRTLARPEIVTVENSKATVSLGEEIPYATVSSAGTQIQFKEAVLKLEVTPTVTRERIGNEDVTKIKMVVIVENNSRGDTISPAPGVSVPLINRRKAETQVLMREGERLVIGGVTQSVHQSTVRKVPVFGDIPLLGWLFKQKENFETGRELVVFLTPTILKTDAAQAAQTAPGK
ncbi:MAG: AMIN domain-containing protein [Candidatus Rokubacteria bacterium]|nr:AMIN domain-containing protein [Candidatus Rokubacteria bacterium]